MNILQISASYKPAYIYGGPIFSVAKLCEGLVAADEDVEVLTTTANGKNELPVRPGDLQVVDAVPVKYFTRITKDHTHLSPNLLRHLYKRLSDLQSNKINTVVHIHAWWNLVSVMACMIVKFKNYPVVLSPRGTLSSYSFGNRNSGIKGLVHRFLSKRLLKYCHFHVTSEIEKQGVLELITPKSVTIIPNFLYLPNINLSRLAHIRKDPAHFKLLFLSRIEEKKGVDILINALSILLTETLPNSVTELKNLKHVTLTIAGTGNPAYINKLKKMACDLGVSENIEWIGQQNQDEKWIVLAKHDLLVLSSHNENFANVVVESLAAGTAVVLSKYVGLVDYVEQNRFGVSCLTTPESVVAAIVSASDLSFLEKVRSTAPQKVREDFSEGKLVPEYQNLYKRVLEAS